jgi:hypothetical protein
LMLHFQNITLFNFNQDQNKIKELNWLTIWNNIECTFVQNMF